MRAVAVERIGEGEVAEGGELAKAGFDDWAKFQRQRIFFSREAHVVELDVAAELDPPIRGLWHAEMNLGAGTGIFVIAISELRGRQVLADLQPPQYAVGGLQRFMDLVRVQRGLCLRAR